MPPEPADEPMPLADGVDAIVDNEPIPSTSTANANDPIMALLSKRTKKGYRSHAEKMAAKEQRVKEMAEAKAKEDKLFEPEPQQAQKSIFAKPRYESMSYNELAENYAQNYRLLASYGKTSNDRGQLLLQSLQTLNQLMCK